jgi:hypothetical protein
MKTTTLLILGAVAAAFYFLFNRNASAASGTSTTRGASGTTGTAAKPPFSFGAQSANTSGTINKSSGWGASGSGIDIAINGLDLLGKVLGKSDKQPPGGSKQPWNAATTPYVTDAGAAAAAVQLTTPRGIDNGNSNFDFFGGATQQQLQDAFSTPADFGNYFDTPTFDFGGFA